jgi:choline dehydrogenase-like flavoprotein
MVSSDNSMMFMKSDGPVVVGSGPIGMSIVAALLAQRCKVLLVEAGGDHTDNQSRKILDVELSGSHSSGVSIGRTRQIGGGLNLWGGQVSLPSYQEMSDDKRWPFDHDMLSLYARKGLSVLGTEHELRSIFPHAALSAVQSPISHGFEPIATGWLKKPKLSSVFWDKIKNESLLKIHKNLFIDRIICDPYHRVSAIEGIKSDGGRVHIETDCVILACGTIETNRLLLQKTIDGRNHTWHDLEWLGRGFNDHLDANVGQVVGLESKLLSDIFDPYVYSGNKYTIKLRNDICIGNSDRISTATMLTMPGNIRNSISELRMLLKTLELRRGDLPVKKFATAFLSSCHEIGPLAWRYMRHRRIGSLPRGAANLRVLTEQPIRKDSRITLSATAKDALGVPKVNLNWIKGDEEASAFRLTAMKLKSWIEGSRLGHVLIDPQLINDPTAFVERADDGLHHSGGTRMSETEDSGVVDFDLKVYRSQGLYCCSASVFPRMGFGNPTLLGMALGQRLVEHLTAARQFSR